jgi:hypothetical protein
MTYTYEVTVKNKSNTTVDSYELYIDDEEVEEEPVEIDSGEHNIKITGDSFTTITKSIDVDKSMRDVVIVEPEDGIVVAPTEEQLESLISEDLSRAVDDLGYAIHVNKASERYVELYSPHAETVEIEVVDSTNQTVSHDYEYVAKIVFDDNDSVGSQKTVYSERFVSPVKAVKVIEHKIDEQTESIF